MDADMVRVRACVLLCGERVAASNSVVSPAARRASAARAKRALRATSSRAASGSARDAASGAAAAPPTGRPRTARALRAIGCAPSGRHAPDKDVARAHGRDEGREEEERGVGRECERRQGECGREGGHVASSASTCSRQIHPRCKRVWDRACALVASSHTSPSPKTTAPRPSRLVSLLGMCKMINSHRES
eukprot:4359475-Pleurochrysis_carterae.AAC.5